MNERENFGCAWLVCLCLLYLGCSTVIAEKGCGWMGMRGHLGVGEMGGREGACVERVKGESQFLPESSLDQFAKQQKLCDGCFLFSALNCF